MSLQVQKKWLDNELTSYLTDMENSPGALSLSLTRKAPHSRCLSRLSATPREMRPANQLQVEWQKRGYEPDKDKKEIVTVDVTATAQPGVQALMLELKNSETFFFFESLSLVCVFSGNDKKKSRAVQINADRENKQVKDEEEEDEEEGKSKISTLWSYF